MIDFSVEFQNFIDDMLSNIIDDLNEKNLEYAGYKMYLKENYEKVREIINTLPKDEKKFMNEYESNFFNKIRFIFMSRVSDIFPCRLITETRNLL